MKKDDLKNQLLVEDPPTHLSAKVMKQVQPELDLLRKKSNSSWFEILSRRRVLLGALGSLAFGWFGWKLLKSSDLSSEEAALISFSEMDPHLQDLELIARLELNEDDLQNLLDDDLEMLDDETPIEELDS